MGRSNSRDESEESEYGRGARVGPNPGEVKEEGEEECLVEDDQLRAISAST
jgi:hypothetical protein